MDYRVRRWRAQQEHKQNTDQRNPGNHPERVDVGQHVGFAAHNAGEHRRAVRRRLANSPWIRLPGTRSAASAFRTIGEKRL